ncbi:MAG: primosomal protein N' [Alphaproteobacteria bacterium CG11_big_fil_rev_8_21_14_0_20_39_49]|nr:MAG: primosomal protein N' [Alphaproteobacteria bacterium CG11_big_fil_rev_8_21_14_0_20_39_49]
MENTETNLVKVLFPLFLPEPLTYSVPADSKIKEGDFVRANLGNKSVIGVVWQTDISDSGKYKIKPINKKLNVRPLSPDLMKFINWVADYTLSGKGMVLKMAMSSPKALEDEKQITAYEINKQALSDIKISKHGMRVISLLNEAGIPLTASEIEEQAAVGKSVIKTLVDKGAIKITLIEPRRDIPHISKLDINLSASQQIAADELCKKVEAQKFSATLLDGVTGSGKTEVYFSAIEQALQIEGSQILIMLPEIALTTQIVHRFEQKFGFEPTKWHSGLTPARKEKNWRDISNGRARLIIGARSALFLPYTNLRAIIVDEEHDGSYKQEEGVIYHARDMAVVRAGIEKCPIILASATPSIETVENVRSGKYSVLKLDSRFGEAVMPDIKIVDMRKEKLRADKWISSFLKEQLAQNIIAGRQSLLFLNRRGYAPLTLCRECGFRFKCPDCSSWLVEHKSFKKLMCHHCGFNRHIPEQCPECNKEDRLVSCGPGVERIVEELQDSFPTARICLMTGDNITSSKQVSEVLRSITDGEVDIIVGTQVIAKGHHFPELTHVGVIDADLGLEGGDLRASEHTYQLLQQVAGRAGREKQKGTVIMQSYMPDNSVMKSLSTGSRDDFINTEIQSRMKTKMPPYSRLASIIISGKNERLTQNIAKAIVRAAPLQDEVRVMGPVPATIYMLRGNYRFRILIKTMRNINIQKWIAKLLSQVKTPASVNVKVDIDPYSFM